MADSTMVLAVLDAEHCTDLLAAYREALRRGGFEKLVGWKTAAASFGFPGLHFHDLWHPGNLLAAASGASTRDLMVRMGHDSMNAALPAPQPRG